MEEKKNISLGSPQQLLDLKPSTNRPPSEALKKALLKLDLLVEDFEKSGSFLRRIEHFISAPLEFDILQEQVKHFTENLKTVTGRAVENHQNLAGDLEDIYRQTVELENAISETHESINSRFTFWLHSFQAGSQGDGEVSQEVSSFSEFANLFAEKHVGYAYFLAPFGLAPLLICRYISLDADSEDSEPDTVQLSTYVAPPTGLFQALKRAWNKLFGSPNMSVLHLFHYSRLNLPIGTFKKRLLVLMKPYLPYRHSEPDQLPKVIYDFINIHGISGSRHIHLLKRDDKCAVFTTQRPIQFDGRLLHLSDVDCPTESPKARHQLLIE